MSPNSITIAEIQSDVEMVDPTRPASHVKETMNRNLTTGWFIVYSRSILLRTSISA